MRAFVRQFVRLEAKMKFHFLTDFQFWNVVPNQSNEVLLYTTLVIRLLLSSETNEKSVLSAVQSTDLKSNMKPRQISVSHGVATKVHIVLPCGSHTCTTTNPIGLAYFIIPIYQASPKLPDHILEQLLTTISCRLISLTSWFARQSKVEIPNLDRI